MRDLRMLLIRAAESYRTISLECDAEYRIALLQREMLQARSNAAKPESRSVVSFSSPPIEDDANAADAHVRHAWHVWWCRPDRWRDDITWTNGQVAVCIVRGAASLFYLSSSGTLRANTVPRGPFERLWSNVRTPKPGYLPTVDDRLSQMPLVQPAPLANGWELSELGEREYAGRAAIAVHAARLEESSRFGLWAYVNEYDLLVDRERGVLLRCAGLVDGTEAGVLSVRSIRFDEPIRDEVFAFEPPPGTRIVHESADP